MADENNKSMMDIEYVPMYRKNLGEALIYAKGKMTMAEFAEKCGMNPFTFTRIVKGDIKKPLSQEEIKIIAENSEMPTEDTFDYLIKANGMVPKSDDTPRRQKAQKRSAEHRQRRETIQNSLIRSLLERGCTIVPVVNTPKESLNPIKKSRYRLGTDISYVLSVQGSGPEYWNFRIDLFTGDEYKNDPAEYDSEVKFEVASTARNAEDLFLREIWEPEAFENTKFSFVFVNRDVFEGFFRFFEDIKVYDPISLILVDLNEQRVTEERFLRRHDGKEQESLFRDKGDS